MDICVHFVRAGRVCTMEAIEALHLRGALVLARSDFTSPDALYQAIRRPSRVSVAVA